jgi:hypothetical protein
VADANQKLSRFRLNPGAAIVRTSPPPVSMPAKEDQTDPAALALARRRRRRRAFWLTLITLALLPTALQREWLHRGGPRLAMVRADAGGPGAGAPGAPRAAIRLRTSARAPAPERCAYEAWTPSARQTADAAVRPITLAELSPAQTLRATIGDPEGEGAIIPISQVTPGTSPTSQPVVGPPGGGDPLTPIQPVVPSNPPVVTPDDPTLPLDPGPQDPGPQDPGPLDPGGPIVFPTDPGTPVITPIGDPGGNPTEDPGGPTGLPTGPGGETPIRPPEPVPEPAAWMTMILGFGLTGASLRRRGLAS